MTPHPQALGSALTHPHITTDYSEAQLELITGVHATPETCLEELLQVHQFTYRALADEMLWVSSMPCNLPADENIPDRPLWLVERGPRQERVPHGLGAPLRPAHADHLRHPLQLVAARGSSEQYFALIRNFRRHAFCCCTCSALRPPSVPASWRAASMSCKRWRTAPCTCRTELPCAWAPWATRARRRPASP
jgi:glutamate--cysteine ligase